MKMKLVGTAEPFDEVQFVHPDALRLFEVAEVSHHSLSRRGLK
jgi:hypothetical protein